MTQTTAIVNALKVVLKTHNKTYADIGNMLELSEANVKRMFSKQTFTLKRLEQICKLLDMEISDLVVIANQESGFKDQLSLKQEKILVSNIKLLLIAYCLINHWSFQEIIQYYCIDELEGIQLLAQLDRLKIIELLPKNKVKLLISSHFSWRKNGPIQHFFETHVENEFFQSSFNDNNELKIILNGMLANQSNAILQKKILRLGKEFHTLTQDDVSYPLADRHGSTLVLAIRAWGFGVFEELRRK